jgi:hypothetical protein
MAQLHRRDFQAILDFLAGVYGTRSLDEYVDFTIRELRSLVPCDISVYNEVNTRRRRSRFVVDPIDVRAIERRCDTPRPGSVRVPVRRLARLWHGPFPISLR